MLVGPDCVEVGARRLRLGAGYCATFAVTGYPATVGGVFLETIFSWPGRLDVADGLPDLRRGAEGAACGRSASGHAC